jgi:probable F420-dependent oxidoreductase
MTAEVPIAWAYRDDFMKFGVTLRGLHPREYPALALSAEQHGFESVWVPDHIFFPAAIPPTFPYTTSGVVPVDPWAPIYDPLLVLSAIASATSTVRLGTNVFILPLRHPVVTAHSVATLDQLSGGRVILGVGVGWLENEFTVLSQPFAQRGRRTSECIELIRALWSSDVVSRTDGSYPLPGVVSQPKPVQSSAGTGVPSVPILVGGVSPAAIRRAARLGDGWMQPADHKGLDDLATHIRDLDAARAEFGRSDLPWDVTTRLGTDEESARRCEELGVTRVLAAGPPGPSEGLTVADYHEWFRRFSDEVIAKFP